MMRSDRKIEDLIKQERYDQLLQELKELKKSIAENESKNIVG